MSQTSPPNRMAALKDDGFVDFYELLGIEPDATVTRIRTTINALYNEAQSNRDHRNLNRRREYQTLLQLLPQAREILLDQKKRDRYDAFREDVQRGVTSISFEDWTRGLKEEEEKATAGQSAVLGVHEEERVEAKAETTAPAKPAKPKAQSRVIVGESPAAPSRSSLTGSVITVIVFFMLFVLLYVVFSLEISIALLVACIAATVAWLVTHRKGSRPTRV